MTGDYFIRPGGNHDPRRFNTMLAAIGAAVATVKETGYSCDVFDAVEYRGIVAADANGWHYMDKRASKATPLT